MCNPREVDLEDGIVVLTKSPDVNMRELIGGRHDGLKVAAISFWGDEYVDPHFTKEAAMELIEQLTEFVNAAD